MEESVQGCIADGAQRLAEFDRRRAAAIAEAKDAWQGRIIREKGLI